MKESKAVGSTAGVYPDGGRSIWLLGMLITFRAVAEETGGDYSLYEQTVPPQLGPPPHIHHQETEAFYVLEGKFEFLKGDQTVTASSGSFVYVPKGVLHTFRNVGEIPARFLAIVTPGGLHEKLLGEIGEPAKSQSLPSLPEGPPDVERIVRIAQKYGTELPPPQRSSA